MSVIAKSYAALHKVMKSLVLLGLLILLSASTSLVFSIQMDEKSVAPPLERAPASHSEVQDTQGRELNYVLVDQQVLIVADVTNALDKQLPFAYIVQIEDETGVIVSLGWLTGTLSPNQLLSPALSWTPQYPGTYHARVFVWEGIDIPSPLSHTLGIDIDVRFSEA